MYFFEAIDIEKTYGQTKALDKVSIHVPQGSIYGLLGPNGAGKTTLIRIINQITGPDQGRVIFDGRPLEPNDVARIGYLPEERGLYKKMKVGEQSLYLAQLKGLSKTEALKRLKEWFTKYNIIDWWDRRIDELSKGMAQKIQFITTILHDPDLLIFDEPFSGFDPINSTMLKNELLDLKARGKTVILSTHDMASVEELCDNISLINRSKVILEGKVDEIRERYKEGISEVIGDKNGNDMVSLLPAGVEVLQTEEMLNGYTRWLLKPGKDDAHRSLLQVISPKMHIHSFREILPSMNEVFIKAVESIEIPSHE